MVQQLFRTGSGPNVLIAYGANLPYEEKPPLDTITSAIKRLAAEGLAVRRVSLPCATAAFPAGSGNDYVNGCLAAESSLAPDEILARLMAVEAAFGRRREARWGSRTLDLDLLAVGDRVLPDEATFRRWAGLPVEAQLAAAPDALILPHPRMHERAFVLVPLAEVAPDWRHPVFGQTVAEMLAALPADAVAAVRRL